jgi:hypothetical protein
MIGQIGERRIVEIDHVAEIDRRGSALLAVAELPVCGQQIRKIDAAEGLALADRLRIVHGGRDQLVEADIFDVEGLAHVGAARAIDKPRTSAHGVCRSS